MRLNSDCIRDLLLTLEKNLLIDEDGKTIPLTFEEVSLIPDLKQYERRIIFAHLHKLFEFALLRPGKRYINESEPQIADITDTGYTLIDSIKSDTHWVKFKDSFKKIGSLTMPILIDYALKS